MTCRSGRRSRLFYCFSWNKYNASLHFEIIGVGDGRGGATGMATMAMAIALFGVLWPLIVLAIAFLHQLFTQTSAFDETVFTSGFEIMCLETVLVVKEKYFSPGLTRVRT